MRIYKKVTYVTTEKVEEVELHFPVYIEATRPPEWGNYKELIKVTGTSVITVLYRPFMSVSQSVRKFQIIQEDYKEERWDAIVATLQTKKKFETYSSISEEKFNKFYRTVLDSINNNISIDKTLRIL